MQPLRRGPHPSSARAQTYDQLRDSIVSLALEPGERVSDLAWANDLGVSRTPVREALLQLNDEGLVDVIPQRGTFVAPISVAAVREAQFIREALEVAAVQVAVERIGDAQFATLAANLAGQRAAEIDHDVERFYELDQAFHRQIIDATGFQSVWRLADRSRAHLNRVRRLSLPHPTLIGQLVRDHREIVEALRGREGERAEAAMRDHLRLVLHNLPELVRLHPDFFVDEGEPHARRHASGHRRRERAGR